MTLSFSNADQLQCLFILGQWKEFSGIQQRCIESQQLLGRNSGNR